MGLWAGQWQVIIKLFQSNIFSIILYGLPSEPRKCSTYVGHIIKSNDSYPIFLLSPDAAQDTSVQWKWTPLGRWAPQKGHEAEEKQNMVTDWAKLVSNLRVLDIK